MKSVFSGQIEQVTTRRDNTLKITLGTQELTPQGEVNLFGLRNTLVKVLISSEGITQEQSEAVEDVAVPMRKPKTLSQRLRSKIFVYCEMTGKEFQPFYDSYMNQLAEKWQAKLNELDQ